MAITPSDICDKKFTKSLRGYSEKEVDEFLDELIVELQTIKQERDQLREEAEALKNEVTVQETEISDAAVADKLVSAQKSADLIISQARMAAKYIVTDAQEKAKNFIDTINIQVVEAKCTLNELKQLTQQYKNNFQGFLAEQIDAFNVHYSKIMKVFSDANSTDSVDPFLVKGLDDIGSNVDVGEIKDILADKPATDILFGEEPKEEFKEEPVEENVKPQETEIVPEKPYEVPIEESEQIEIRIESEPAPAEQSFDVPVRESVQEEQAPPEIKISFTDDTKQKEFDSFDNFIATTRNAFEKPEERPKTAEPQYFAGFAAEKEDFEKDESPVTFSSIDERQKLKNLIDEILNDT